MTDEPPSPARDAPPGVKLAEVAARGCLGIVTFALAIVFFVILTASLNPLLGFVISTAAVGALFVIRKRSGPSPMLGAVAIGASIALLVYGTCTLIVFNAS